MLQSSTIVIRDHKWQCMAKVRIHLLRPYLPTFTLTLTIFSKIMWSSRRCSVFWFSSGQGRGFCLWVRSSIYLSKRVRAYLLSNICMVVWCESLWFLLYKYNEISIWPLFYQILHHHFCMSHFSFQMVSRRNYRRCMAEGWDGIIPVCEGKSWNRKILFSYCHDINYLFFKVLAGHHATEEIKQQKSNWMNCLILIRCMKCPTSIRNLVIPACLPNKMCKVLGHLGLNINNRDTRPPGSFHFMDR